MDEGQSWRCWLGFKGTSAVRTPVVAMGARAHASLHLLSLQGMGGEGRASRVEVLEECQCDVPREEPFMQGRRMDQGASPTQV